MATAMAWLDSKDVVADPEFFENSVAVELPELSWHDAENVAYQIESNVEQQTEPEAQTTDPAKEAAAEREERITNAERCFDKTKYDNRLRWWAAQDKKMDAELASGKIQYFDRHRIAFFKVVEQFITFKNRSTLKVQQYEYKGTATCKPSMPNRVDFIADVENVGVKALKDSPVLSSIFQRQAIQNELENWNAVPADIRTQIEHRVGWWFIRAGLHPGDRYWA
jgi:hypothetical protein